ncbi:ribosomal RNA Processing 5 [Xylocopa sonorina]|uniref:ribosomal RNA Processing 5 n=1 Tax=Xylocopa sonorina TaxID=1818115 RepID=UPI00403B11EA
MTLKSFPRGGKINLKNKPTNSLLNKHDKVSKKHREKQKGRKETEEETSLVSTTVERLSYSTISEGLVVLGCIFQVTEYDLMISLPGGTIGRAQITDISGSYTNLLQSLIELENQTNDFKPLPELYSCGDYVVCYIKAVQPQEKWQIAISLEPRLINQNLDVTYVNTGSKIVCSISSIEDHGYMVDVGVANVRAFIPTEECDNDKRLFPGKQLFCHIKEVKASESASTVTLSLKQKLVKGVNKIEINSLDSLTPGTKFNLSVRKVLSNGLYISFGQDYVGYINQLYLDEPLSKYVKGLEITGTLLYVLPLVKFAYFSSTLDKPKGNTIEPGQVVENAVVLFKESNGVVLQLNKNDVRGFVPLKRLNTDINKIVEKFVPGTTHRCRVLSYSWLDRTYVCTMEHSLLEQKYFSLTDFKPGDVMNVKITSINEETGFVNVQTGKFNGQIAPEHVSDEGLSALKKFKVDKEVEARVLSVHTGRNKIYFTLKKSLITSNLPVLADIKDAKPKSKHHGTIIQIHKNGLLVKFFGNAIGWIPHTALDKEASNENWNYSIGQTILAKVESVNLESGKIFLSVVARTTQRVKNNMPRTEDNGILTQDSHLTSYQTSHGTVATENKEKRSKRKRKKQKPEEILETESSDSIQVKQQNIEKPKKIKQENKPLGPPQHKPKKRKSMKVCPWNTFANNYCDWYIPVKRSGKTNNLKTVKAAKLYSHGTIFFSYSLRKALISIREVANTAIAQSMAEEMKSVARSRRKRNLVQRDGPKNARNNVINYKDEEKKPRIPECGFFWNEKPESSLVENKESSSDSEEEVEREIKQKRKKLSAAERREQERIKEREIRQREEALASNQLPNSVDQFDRLVLGSPNSSIIWLQYMAYHLQTAEIDKARAVARRAVKTINFREENERLNVWNAWLNLESKFGTQESLNDVFQEAVRSNDSLKVYRHMLTVHTEAGRQFELEKTINTMIGKFKQNPQIWIDCGEALLKIGLKDKSRHIMQRALQSLPASEHVNLMARFALMENRLGDKERAQTLFEHILSSYPKRVDIWSCYVDALIKSNDIDIARKVLERAIVQTLPPRKMKTLFKKFISFEEQYGTQEDVARVQQMAVEYVEKQCNKNI